MVDPHAHHILFKEGNGEAQKKLVSEGQEILGSYDIDPIWGLENLVWAPNRIAGQHGIEPLQNLVNKLRDVKAFGGSRDKIVRVLKDAGFIAATRR